MVDKKRKSEHSLFICEKSYYFPKVSGKSCPIKLTKRSKNLFLTWKGFKIRLLSDLRQRHDPIQFITKNRKKQSHLTGNLRPGKRIPTDQRPSPTGPDSPSRKLGQAVFPPLYPDRLQRAPVGADYPHQPVDWGSPAHLRGHYRCGQPLDGALGVSLAPFHAPADYRR